MDEKKHEFPMHIRITDRAFIPFWSKEQGNRRLAGWLGALLTIIWIIIWAVIIHYGDFSRGSGSIKVVIITNAFAALLFIFCFALMMFLPERVGHVSIENDVRFFKPIYAPLYSKVEFKDVEFIVIGYCPKKLNLWYGNRFGLSLVDELYMTRHYGDKYIVACNDKKHELFGLTFNEDAWRLLIEKCPNAVVFESQEEYDDYCQEEIRRANAFEEEMKKKSGIQSFEGYIN